MNFKDTRVTFQVASPETLKTQAVVVESGIPAKAAPGAQVIPVACDLQGADGDETLLRDAYARAIAKAGDAKRETLAVPTLAVEQGFPPVGSAKILAQELIKYLKKDRVSFKEVVIYSSRPEHVAVFETTITGYITHVRDNLGQGPYVTVDAIIEMEEGIILIERSNPPYGWALPGGFVDCGESLERAVRREAKEETNLELENLRQLHTYSDPARDPRFHTVSTVFVATGRGRPASGDDAKALKIVPYAELLKLNYAFDHKQVLADYLQNK